MREWLTPRYKCPLWIWRCLGFWVSWECSGYGSSHGTSPCHFPSLRTPLLICTRSGQLSVGWGQTYSWSSLGIWLFLSGCLLMAPFSRLGHTQLQGRGSWVFLGGDWWVLAFAQSGWPRQESTLSCQFSENFDQVGNELPRRFEG